MKAIKEVLGLLEAHAVAQHHGKLTSYGVYGIDQAEAEIKKIVLKWVGENYSRVRSLTDERIIWVRGYNQAKEEIKRKVEDDKKC